MKMGMCQRDNNSTTEHKKQPKATNVYSSLSNNKITCDTKLQIKCKMHIGNLLV